ncbi:uncharacterized protein LOC113287661 isoform X2 [Papaver somniferum]|uniref:uncharacterized protein LOC113287661 isoform X2 n=1 Tax=Papaver somniferum TaxID=3469 RepID=UPI000E70381D|nr:uncharacterized protein LOC113287661 isoform X2 [Papaver somniferum]
MEKNPNENEVAIRSSAHICRVYRGAEKCARFRREKQIILDGYIRRRKLRPSSLQINTLLQILATNPRCGLRIGPDDQGKTLHFLWQGFSKEAELSKITTCIMAGQTLAGLLEDRL